jgi:hypothetical protein
MAQGGGLKKSAGALGGKKKKMTQTTAAKKKDCDQGMENTQAQGSQDNGCQSGGAHVKIHQ